MVPAAAVTSGAATEPEAGGEEVARFWLTVFALTPSAYITRSLIAVNLVVFASMTLAGVSLTKPTPLELLNWGANFGPSTLDGEWWRLLTCTFVHIGIIHIALNMWVLSVGGPLVERMLGNIGFLLLYIISGLGGSLASLLWHPDVVSAGASGAVFGVYGGLLGILQRQRGTIPPAALSGLKSSGLTFLGLNLVFGLTQPNIDMAAHVGGLATGFLCGLLLSRPFTREGAAGRVGQNILAAGAGAAAIVIGAVVVSSMHPNWVEAERDLARIEAAEQRALDTYNSALVKAQRGEITDIRLAEILERDVLPEWRTATARLGQLRDLPGEAGRYATARFEYSRLQQESWELTVEAMRKGDETKAERAAEKQRQADEAAKRISAGK